MSEMDSKSIGNPYSISYTNSYLTHAILLSLHSILGAAATVYIGGRWNAMAENWVKEKINPKMILGYFMFLSRWIILGYFMFLSCRV